MPDRFEKYMLHPVEKEITDADAKVDLIRSKDNPIMDFFYESCYYRHPYVVSKEEYALPCEELFMFISTADEDEKLGATIAFTVNGERHIIDHACMIQVPALVPHGPIEVLDVETPIFSYCATFSREHVSMPKEYWKTENVPAFETMVLNANPGINEPHINNHQHYVILGLAGKTMPGIITADIRRFEKTDGWKYVETGHCHGSPELLGYYGTDPWHPYELNGTYTQYIGGKKFIIDKPTACYFPAYVPHCPVYVENITKQNFWHCLGRSVGTFNQNADAALADISVANGELDLKEPW